MSKTSEYQEEYCGLAGKRKGKAGESDFIKCSKSEDVQPVGGRCGAIYRQRQEELARQNALSQSGVIIQRFAPHPPLPVPDIHKLRYMHNNYMTHDDWY